MTRPTKSKEQEHAEWIARKRRELEEMRPWVQEVARDREAGRLTADERGALESRARDIGRELTEAEANWWLGSLRAHRSLWE